jgi:hypothetical protein
MRLTNYIRDAFIEAAMQDVPKKSDNKEELRKIASDDIVSRLPKSIQKIWKDNGEERAFLIVRHASYAGIGYAHPAISEYSGGERNLSEEVKKKMKAAEELRNAEEKILKDLRNKLKGAAYACTTTKQLRELLPEFDKYLPEEQAQTARSLPVVANIVADFAKAGWPKKSGATK